jgi:hypothetical protein
MGDMRAGLAAAAALATCAIAIGGCGGGGDDKSAAATTTTAQSPAITAPISPTTSTARQPRPDNSRNQSAPDSAASNVARAQSAMAAFYSCLSRQGVEPSPLTGTSLHGAQLGDRDLVRREIEAKIACIPALPPRLQGYAEQVKRRFEERQR